MNPTIYEIIEELNENNGSKYKMETLAKHKENELLQRVLKMTYDTATFTYGVTLKNVVETPGETIYELSDALDILETEFVDHPGAGRQVSGHAALDRLAHIIGGLNDQDAEVFRKLINRDLRINMGRSNINKVIEGLIVKPVYMRCGTYNEKTEKKFNTKGAFVDLKADGTYREFRVEDGKISCQSRQGEEHDNDYPIINEYLLSRGVEGVFFGELTVYRDGVLLPRQEGNGILKKKVLPDNCVVVFDCWDLVSLEEYAGAIKKQKGTTPYEERRAKVRELLPDHTADPLVHNVREIEGIRVNSIQEALRYTAKIMKRGLEGTIIKEADAVFFDGTSLQQLKLKLEIELEVRLTGFNEGTPGTARAKTFGSANYETDDGMIKGAVVGFKNKDLVDINSRREEVMHMVFTLRCNDITKAKNNDFYALSHARFVEIRYDKDTTDTFESAMAAKRSAMKVDEDIALEMETFDEPELGLAPSM